MTSTRRGFLKAGAPGLGLSVAGTYARPARAALRRPLIDGVRSMCRRLGAAGWREMLLDVTGGALDIMASDLQAELLKPLPSIDRRFAGFAAFAAAGRAAIQPGQPDYSLLYHAVAAPSVIQGRAGAPFARLSDACRNRHARELHLRDPADFAEHAAREERGLADSRGDICDALPQCVQQRRRNTCPTMFLAHGNLPHRQPCAAVRSAPAQFHRLRRSPSFRVSRRAAPLLGLSRRPDAGRLGLVSRRRAAGSAGHG